MTFTDPDVFMGMVRNRYAPVYRHRDVDFGDAEVDGDTMTITATLVDGDNQLWTALYTLERQPDGRWLINSCKLIRPVESVLRTGSPIVTGRWFGATSRVRIGGRLSVTAAG